MEATIRLEKEFERGRVQDLVVVDLLASVEDSPEKGGDGEADEEQRQVPPHRHGLRSKVIIIKW